jgi:FSR family fosmidomycin resistance protein-like MFS transporter
LGALADVWGIERVYHLCSYLPALGLFAGLLPNVEPRRHPR